MFKKFLRILQQARSANLRAAGLPPPLNQAQWRTHRRRFLRQVVATGGAGLLAGALPGFMRQAWAGADPAAARIAIIGAGLAGLNAAFQLQKAGRSAEVYEASNRLGGRVHTTPFPGAEHLLVERGGELINTDHADMLALINEFSLALFDRRADAAAVAAPAETYYFAGKTWSEGELAGLCQPLVAQISNDASLIDQDWDTHAPKFDRLSVRDYLDQHATLIPQPVVRSLFENAIRTEYGVEAGASTALQLLFLLPVVDGAHLEPLGYSDEVYTVQDGNARIIDHLAAALDGHIHTGMALTELNGNGKNGYELHFANGREIKADIVILALPFAALRRVKLKASLPGKMRRFIDELDLGKNDKVLAAYNERVWRNAKAFSLAAWTDVGCSEVWDATQRQKDQTGGALVYYLGGDEVGALDKRATGGASAGAALTKRLAAYLPPLAAAASDLYVRTLWTKNPSTHGAYASFRPGQLTRYGEYLWVESEVVEENQSVQHDGLIFAGEHLSDEYYGFMNGAAQTGRLAAQAALQLVSSGALRSGGT